ncbi:hypothetical protein BS47DRAFT_1341465 [Hydnum rufescens UP504]|uniref:Uncharacterized protein n=1 Tax=Hydnum rufescens UP504 TaxID=1448309 RepID=A0A9P6DYD9_9AGAM|nr:hypothetical protein BS47DRAFT_1341465 [Hydnum rufescens UP504]
MLRWRQIAPLILLALIPLYLSGLHQQVFSLYPTTEVPFNATSEEATIRPSRVLGKPITEHSSLRPSESSTTPPPYPTQAPSITIIAVWTRREKPVVYLENFFASVAANPQVDLLFVNYDRHQVGCDQPLSHIPNAREICLSNEEYWTLHADFLCNRWKCDEHEREVVLAKLYERAPGDHVNSFFRPFRSTVFAKWVNPDTPIWGWCDMDTMLGNFERNFPWDVAKDFDILAPSLPIHGDNILLFTPGHLAFFRNSPDVVDQFMTFPNLVNADAFATLPWIGSDSEEVEYSNFAFLNTNLTFLRFHALVPSRFHLASPGRGVYGLENGPKWDLSLPTSPTSGDGRAAINTILDQRGHEWKQTPTFSKKGREYVVELREGLFPEFVWFPKHFAVDFVPDYTQIPRAGKRYAMRRAKNGPVTDRMEPDDVIVLPPKDGSMDFDRYNRPFFVEFLYVHFQVEKYAKWWDLPQRAVGTDQVLFTDKDRGLQVWDSNGQIIFDTGMVDENEVP